MFLQTITTPHATTLKSLLLLRPALLLLTRRNGG